MIPRAPADRQTDTRTDRHTVVAVVVVVMYFRALDTITVIQGEVHRRTDRQITFTPFPDTSKKHALIISSLGNFKTMSWTHSGD